MCGLELIRSVPAVFPTCNGRNFLASARLSSQASPRDIRCLDPLRPQAALRCTSSAPPPAAAEAAPGPGSGSRRRRRASALTATVTLGPTWPGPRSPGGARARGRARRRRRRWAGRWRCSRWPAQRPAADPQRGRHVQLATWPSTATITAVRPPPARSARAAGRAPGRMCCAAISRWLPTATRRPPTRPSALAGHSAEAGHRPGAPAGPGTGLAGPPGGRWPGPAGARTDLPPRRPAAPHRPRPSRRRRSRR
jgi:hypothetical protein